MAIFWFTLIGPVSYYRAAPGVSSDAFTAHCKSFTIFLPVNQFNPVWNVIFLTCRSGEQSVQNRQINNLSAVNKKNCGLYLNFLEYKPWNSISATFYILVYRIWPFIYDINLYAKQVPPELIWSNLIQNKPCLFGSGLKKFAFDFIVAIFVKNAKNITCVGLILYLQKIGLISYLNFCKKY